MFHKECIEVICVTFLQNTLYFRSDVKFSSRGQIERNIVWNPSKGLVTITQVLHLFCQDALCLEKSLP
jgi:hypothetical protein